MYNFLWNSQTERIKRNIIIAPYDQGGLKMLDSRTQEKALKLKWIYALYREISSETTNNIWFEWVKLNIPCDIVYFLKCNLNIKDMDNVLKFPKNSMWRNVFKYWSELNYDFHPAGNDNVQKQSIWFNSLIRCNNKVMFNIKMFNAGIKYVSDLIYKDNWIDSKQLSTKYECNVNFLELLTVIRNLPNRWKYNLVIEAGAEYTYLLETQNFTCKDLYNKLLSRNLIIPETYVQFWNIALDLELDDIEWTENYQDVFKWTISSKLRSFYYQLRMKDIMCNNKLHKMKKIADPACDWCDNDNQHIIHLFWDCPSIINIWKETSQHINDILGCDLVIKKELIFLYDIEAGNLTTVIHLIILIVCRAIYVCKCIGIKPSWAYALSQIEEVERIERIISVKNNKLMLHLKKWGKFAKPVE